MRPQSKPLGRMVRAAKGIFGYEEKSMVLYIITTFEVGNLLPLQ